MSSQTHTSLTDKGWKKEIELLHFAVNHGQIIFLLCCREKMLEREREEMWKKIESLRLGGTPTPSNDPDQSQADATNVEEGKEKEVGEEEGKEGGGPDASTKNTTAKDANDLPNVTKSDNT